MDDKRKEPNATDDFKAEVQKATQAAAEQVAFWREFYKEWIPGGMRRRKRFRTKGHGARKAQNRKRNKAARVARRKNRRSKKRRS